MYVCGSHLECCSFWDPVFIPELCDDRVAKNLLYIEALASVKSAEWEISDDVRKQLSALQRKGHKKEVRFEGSMGSCGCVMWAWVCYVGVFVCST